MKRRLLVATPLFLATVPVAQAWQRLAAGDVPDALVRVAGTAFGTVVSLCAPVQAGSNVRGALHRAMREVQRIDSLLSLYRPDSQLSRLNRCGRLDGADPHLLANLDFGQRLAMMTNGAFDVTVQPLWELFDGARRAGGEGALPTPAQIGRARRQVDYHRVRIEGDRVRLERPDTRVTLNAVAQGYAADIVLAILREEGIHAALVDTGELGNLGRRQARAPWTVGVQHPRERGAFCGLVRMDGRVVSTSGDYAAAFSRDYRYHHIFDPDTGVSPLSFSSTIVLAQSGLVADGLSTALMVLDPGAGRELLRRFPGADALWIDKQGGVDATPGVPFARA
jgi:thiamine biosynthesis lipoprotein